MKNKFNTVPVDDDTKIFAQVETDLGEYEILYQKWGWDGVVAESIIFLDDEVSNLSETELENLVRESPLVNVNSKLTISRCRSGFTFVNFNFLSV